MIDQTAERPEQLPAIATRWIVMTSLWLLAWALVFHQPLLSAASVWLTNDTFNHCFLVLPAVLYAIWQQRGLVLASNPGFSFSGAVLVLACLFTLVLGEAASINSLQHLAVFGMIPAAALMLFGWQVVRHIAAPLLFIFFSVPIGEELIPLFQKITADIAIALLQWLAIPVYRDGLYISVPNGHFVVAEACSGVRFFIACVVLGSAYAYLNFVSRWRAFCFILFSIFLPIVTNGIRAFGIIYVGYATNMQHAAGADHLIYGWFFFAIVVVLLLTAGHYFSDGHRPWHNHIDSIHPRWIAHHNRWTIILAAIPMLFALSISQFLARHQEAPFTLLPTALLEVTTPETVQSLNWTPRLSGADQLEIGQDRTNGIQYFRAVFHVTKPDLEMVSWQNRVYDIEQWSMKNEYTYTPDGLTPIRILDLSSLRNQPRLLAYWYVTPHYQGSSAIRTKLQQAINTLLLAPSGGALVVVSLNYRGNQEQAQAALERALNQNARTLSQY